MIINWSSEWPYKLDWSDPSVYLSLVDNIASGKNKIDGKNKKGEDAPDLLAMPGGVMNIDEPNGANS